MSLFKLNIVFHKILNSECYETLSQEDLERHLRFVAVNTKIQKQVPAALTPFIIQERQLGWYNPFMQHNRFCETSVFFHAWKNPSLFLEQPYIGFFHYDMIIKKEALEFITETIATAAGEQVLFAPYCHEARRHFCQVIDIEGWEIFVRLYNNLFQKQHTIYAILDSEIPLYHTFILHRETFHRMMMFAEIAIPRLFELLQCDTRHLPYMIERLHGLFLALQRLDGCTGTWHPIPGILHEDRLKDLWDK